MRKKQLEIALQKLAAHPSPSAELEQYMTPGDVAATLLHMAYARGDIARRTICDLGCGTGRLAIGAALLGAKKVIGVDIDPIALKIAARNARRVGANITWIRCDVGKFESSGINTVIQNPPFGVQRRGADMKFLHRALKLAGVVYSLHKATPRNRAFIAKRAKELDVKITDRLELDFRIPRQFEFHTRDTYKFKVDLYRIERGDKNG
ncbi:MAG: METTL5 family protein [Candidatus Hodarchaeaceae archaeon]|nr:METTL5 family protein [Candidatus Hodarchaeaceae archaeon]